MDLSVFYSKTLSSFMGTDGFFFPDHYEIEPHSLEEVTFVPPWYRSYPGDAITKELKGIEDVGPPRKMLLIGLSGRRSCLGRSRKGLGISTLLNVIFIFLLGHRIQFIPPSLPSPYPEPSENPTSSVIFRRQSSTPAEEEIDPLFNIEELYEEEQ